MVAGGGLCRIRLIPPYAHDGCIVECVARVCRSDCALSVVCAEHHILNITL